MNDDEPRKIRMSPSLTKEDRMVLATWSGPKSKQTIPGKGEFFMLLDKEQYEAMGTVLEMLGHRAH
jgi:hypothetical protein